jgi:four helix bundle protein
MQDPTKLRVWHLAHELSTDVVRLLPSARCRGVPALRLQAIRAAASVPSSIAAGCGTRSPRDFAGFLESALAALLELQHRLADAREASVLPERDHEFLQGKLTTVRRMLISFVAAVARVPDPGVAPPAAAHAVAEGVGAAVAASAPQL